MRCPKCGAFVEGGRKICFMCGASIDPNQEANFNVNNPADTGNDIIQSTLNESLNSTISGVTMASPTAGGFSTGPDMMNQNAGFGTGAFGGAAGGFSNGSTQGQSPMNTVANNANNKKDNHYQAKPHEEQDIFDFYEKNKTVIKVFLFIIVIALVGFIGYQMYLKALEPEEKVPRLHELYFEISEDYVQTINNKDKVTFNKSGTKGTECSVEVRLGTTTSENHAEEFQKGIVAELTPERDKEGKPNDLLKEFTTQTNSLTINNHQWHYMNLFYRKSLSSTEYTVLKYQLMTAMKNGYSYDIILTNNSSSSVCSTSLDNFIKSLEFVEKEK